MIKADASKADSGDGVHWAAIDVTTEHGPDTVYVFLDRKSGVFTVRSPNPPAGPGQYEWNSFPNIEYFHGWYKNRFGREPSPVKMFGQEGGSAGLPTVVEPKAGAPPRTTSSGWFANKLKNWRESRETKRLAKQAKKAAQAAAAAAEDARLAEASRLAKNITPTLEEVQRLVPPGTDWTNWGIAIFGQGPQDAKNRLLTVTREQMLALGVNRDVAQALYHWYKNSASGGLAARDNRIKLLEHIIGLF